MKVYCVSNGAQKVQRRRFFVHVLLLNIMRALAAHWPYTTLTEKGI